MVAGINQRPGRERSSGWQPEGDGWYSAPSHSTPPTTPEFQEFAKAGQARWDFLEFLKEKISQHSHKKNG